MNLSVLKFRVFEEVDLVPENNLMQLYQIVRGFRLNENSLSSNLILPEEEGKLQGLGIPLSARSRITTAELISEEREERI